MTYNLLGTLGSNIVICTGDEFLNLLQLRWANIVHIHSNHYWYISYVIAIMYTCKVIGGKAGAAITWCK